MAPPAAHPSPADGKREIPLIPGLTGVVLTHNGERLLAKCLSSLSFCDALLVVDSGSGDGTLELAKAHGARVARRKWEGFAVQFTYAQTLVGTRWFFILAQDEICPPSLGKRIVQAVQEADRLADTPQDAPTAFSVGRKSWYFNRFMRHGGWYPDPVPRVFRTGFVSFSQGAHIRYHPLGRSEHIGGPPAEELIHYPYASFFHQLEKLNSYAEQGALSLRAGGKSGGILPGVGHGLVRFCRIYFAKRGFLDGRAGFLAACHGSFYAFLKYVRVLESDWGAPYNG